MYSLVSLEPRFEVLSEGKSLGRLIGKSQDALRLSGAKVIAVIDHSENSDTKVQIDSDNTESTIDNLCGDLSLEPKPRFKLGKVLCDKLWN
jgi:hypothetical protein